MLVIGRKIGQRVMIDNDIIIEVIAKHSNAATLLIIQGSVTEDIQLTVSDVEHIVFGDNIIKVMLVSVKKGLIRLGFEAPKHVIIKREEIYDGQIVG